MLKGMPYATPLCMACRLSGRSVAVDPCCPAIGAPKLQRHCTELQTALDMGQSTGRVFLAALLMAVICIVTAKTWFALTSTTQDPRVDGCNATVHVGMPYTSCLERSMTHTCFM
jgi:hypothetical protein